MSAPPSPVPSGSEAGPASTSRAHSGPNPLPADRREANRLAAARSRARQAERGGILEIMAKGLAEENRELRERVEVLIRMGIKVEMVDNGKLAVGKDALGGNDERSLQKMDEDDANEPDTGALSRDADENGPIDPAFPLSSQTDVRLREHSSTNPQSRDSIPSMSSTHTQTLHTTLVNHYTALLSELKQQAAAPGVPTTGSGSAGTERSRADQEESTLAPSEFAQGVAHGAEAGEGGQAEGSGMDIDLDIAFSGIPDLGTRASQNSATTQPSIAYPALEALPSFHEPATTLTPLSANPHPQTPALRTMLLSLQSGISDAKADVQELRAELASLGGAVASSSEGVSGGTDVGLSVERCLGDVRRRVGQLLTHYNPSFVDPSLPYLALSAQTLQAALLRTATGVSIPLVLPPKFAKIDLPEPSRRGRPTRSAPSAPRMGVAAVKRSAAKALADGGETDEDGVNRSKRRGRPKGSKNRPRSESLVDGEAEDEEASKSPAVKKGKKRKDVEENAEGATEGEAQPASSGRLRKKNKVISYDEDSLDEDLISMTGGGNETASGNIRGLVPDFDAIEASIPGGVAHENDFAGLYAAQEQAGQTAAAAVAAAAAEAVAATLVIDQNAEAGPSSRPADNDAPRAGSAEQVASSPRSASTPSLRPRTGAKASAASKRKSKVEPPRRYRIPGDDETIYIESTVNNPDGTEGIAITKIPVHTHRPYNGQGKKRGPKPKWMLSAEVTDGDSTGAAGTGAGSGNSPSGGDDYRPDDSQDLLSGGQYDHDQRDYEEAHDLDEHDFTDHEVGLEPFQHDTGEDFGDVPQPGQLNSLVAAMEAEGYLLSETGDRQ